MSETEIPETNELDATLQTDVAPDLSAPIQDSNKDKKQKTLGNTIGRIVTSNCFLLVVLLSHVTGMALLRYLVKKYNVQ